MTPGGISGTPGGDRPSRPPGAAYDGTANPSPSRHRATGSRPRNRSQNRRRGHLVRTAGRLREETIGQTAGSLTDAAVTAQRLLGAGYRLRKFLSGNVQATAVGGHRQGSEGECPGGISLRSCSPPPLWIEAECELTTRVNAARLNAQGQGGREAGADRVPDGSGDLLSAGQTTSASLPTPCRFGPVADPRPPGQGRGEPA